MKTITNEKITRYEAFVALKRENRELYLQRAHSEDKRIFKITHKEQANYRKMHGGKTFRGIAYQFGVTMLLLKDLEITEDNYLVPFSKENI